MEQKISNTKLAYYIKDGIRQLLTIDDALLRVENGIVLRDHLFDIEGVERGQYIPLKFVSSTKQACYFATKALTTSKKGTHSLGNKGINTLHEKAKDFLLNFEGIKLVFGNFIVGNEYITEILEEQSVEFIDESGLNIIRPDIIIKTLFMNFFIEITVTHGIDENKMNLYKKYRYLNDLDMPFIVVEINLSDLQEIVRTEGYDRVKDEVINRLIYNSDYKEVYPILSFDKGGKPFLTNTRSNTERHLVINTHADSIDMRLRDRIINSSLKNYIHIDSFLTEDSEGRKIKGVDELHSLYFTDDSYEGALYPLNCPIHKEHPMRIVIQSQLNKGEYAIGIKNMEKIFFKCDLYESESSRLRGTSYGNSQCNITLDLCDKFNQLSDEFLCVGDFYKFLLGDEGAYNRVSMCRLSASKYRDL